jgi:hypothetical protein
MKLAVGFRQVKGPWGGGNRFVAALSGAAKENGHQVVETLSGKDIDIILMMDPRWRHPNVTFTPGDVFRYLQFRNSRAVVVHRINECDERKGGGGMNWRLRVANYCADHTVFVGAWLQGLRVWENAIGARASVITNGADTAIFNPTGWEPWHGDGPLRLVTHHWGNHLMKGFDIYSRLDALLDHEAWRDRFSFTYVGNLPAGFKFRNARHVAPLDGLALAAEIKRHHGYITASINEPGGNHQNEGALCGLPLLYRRSGCMPEYCQGFGVEFSEVDFESALNAYRDHYPDIRTRMSAYPHTAANTTAAYLGLFDELLADREKITDSRRLWRSPVRALMTQFPL